MRTRMGWLALLLTRTIETTCDDTWPALRRELERVKLGTFAGPAGTFRQRTELTTTQRAILAKLQLAEPHASGGSPRQPQPPDQGEHSRLDTRRLRVLSPISAGHRPDSRTMRDPSCGTRA